MEDNYTTKQLIQLYFGKQFSRFGRILFGRWLKADPEKPEKWEALQDLWEKTNGEATKSTDTDWLILQKHISFKPSQKHFIFFRRQFYNYAAILALILLTAGTTYWITEHLQHPHHVEMIQLFVPYGENKEALLPDGSKVWVNAGSLLIYPKDFNDADTRTVYLAGEAAFSVRKNTRQPFIVKTTYLDVQALGTVFTVEAYPSDSCSMAILEEGSILVSVKEEGIRPILVKPDQQVIYSHTEHAVAVRQVDASVYQMERKGYLVFENIPFNRLIASLERAFNVTIHYNSQKYAGLYYNVKFSPDETLEDVLNILQQLVGIQYSVKGKVVFIN